MELVEKEYPLFQSEVKLAGEEDAMELSHVGNGSARQSDELLLTTGTLSSFEA